MARTASYSDTSQTAVPLTLVAEVAGLFVVAELEVAVGSRARIHSFDLHDFGAARELAAVFVDEILNKGNGIGNNAVQMLLDLAQLGADFLHLFLGAIDVDSARCGGSEF